jgi:signal transduction histidine kinase
MTDSTLPIGDVEHGYQSILRGAKLHWAHWFIIACSLLLTLFAAYKVDGQVEAKARLEFDRQADQVVELVTERMFKYEDALWSGAAALKSQPTMASYGVWQKFATMLEIEKRHPGINGIGVIFHVEADDVEDFIQSQRLTRPDFKIHPKHAGQEYWPITFIEPEAENAAAVGLDIAFEQNRLTAALAARDTATTQVTAPIVLVQDNQKTPGFLLYVPFNKDLNEPPSGVPKEYSEGLVYAPFIFSKVMAGTLAPERRAIAVKIADVKAAAANGASVLYDELQTNMPGYDAQPMFSKSTGMDIYGRTWQFDIQSNKRFRQQNSSNESLVILIGGLLIDTLLLVLFLFMVRSNRYAIDFAARVSSSYAIKADHLEKANAELEEFAYRTSHDLRSPLLSSIGLLGIGVKAINAGNQEKALTSLRHVSDSLNRLAKLIEDILNVSKANNFVEEEKPLLIADLLDEVMLSLANMDGFERLRLNRDLQFIGAFNSQPQRLTRVLENLLSNAVKYQNADAPESFITVRTYPRGDCLMLEIQDNGLGIPEAQQAKMFTMFNRFHPKVSYGSGLGLYMVKKSVEALNGTITYTSLAKGSLFTLCLPLDAS